MRVFCATANACLMTLAYVEANDSNSGVAENTLLLHVTWLTRRLTALQNIILVYTDRCSAALPIH